VKDLARRRRFPGFIGFPPLRKPCSGVGTKFVRRPTALISGPPLANLGQSPVPSSVYAKHF